MQRYPWTSTAKVDYDKDLIPPGLLQAYIRPCSLSAHFTCSLLLWNDVEGVALAGSRRIASHDSYGSSNTWWSILSLFLICLAVWPGKISHYHIIAFPEIDA